MSAIKEKIEPLTVVFEDDGLVPNNPMPFLVYKGAVAIGGGDPEQTIEQLFGANGWGDMWRNGIFDYLHYHSTVHEALGVARRGCASAATTARTSISRPAMSPSWPPAPAINACPRAMIFPWSAPIRRGRRCRSPGRHRKTMRRR